MTNLRQAREQHKLAQFISEREAEGQPAAACTAFDKTVEAMAGKSSEAPATSPKACSDD